MGSLLNSYFGARFIIRSRKPFVISILLSNSNVHQPFGDGIAHHLSSPGEFGEPLSIIIEAGSTVRAQSGPIAHTVDGPDCVALAKRNTNDTTEIPVYSDVHYL